MVTIDEDNAAAKAATATFVELPAMDYFTVGFFAFLLCVVVSRILSERAFRQLPDDQKIRVMDGFSGMRAYSMLPILVILGVMFGLPKLFPDNTRIGLLIGMGLLASYLVVMHLIVVQRLRKMQLDARYQRRFLLARHVSHLGIILLFGSLLFANMY